MSLVRQHRHRENCLGKQADNRQRVGRLHREAYPRQFDPDRLCGVSNYGLSGRMTANHRSMPIAARPHLLCSRRESRDIGELTINTAKLPI